MSNLTHKKRLVREIFGPDSSFDFFKSKDPEEKYQLLTPSGFTGEQFLEFIQDTGLIPMHFGLTKFGTFNSNIKLSIIFGEIEHPMKDSGHGDTAL